MRCGIDYLFQFLALDLQFPQESLPFLLGLPSFPDITVDAVDRYLPSVHHDLRQGVRHRVEREARAAGKLRHQNIAPVFGMGSDRGLHYYAMELVDGRSLGEVIAELKAGADESPKKSGPFGTTTQGREHFVRLAEAIAGVAEALHAAARAVVSRHALGLTWQIFDDGTGVLYALIAGIAVLSSPGRIDEIAQDNLGLIKAEPSDIIQVELFGGSQ